MEGLTPMHPPAVTLDTNERYCSSLRVPIPARRCFGSEPEQSVGVNSDATGADTIACFPHDEADRLRLWAAS